jgi:hypothetical protein
MSQHLSFRDNAIAVPLCHDPARLKSPRIHELGVVRHYELKSDCPHLFDRFVRSVREPIRLTESDLLLRNVTLVSGSEELDLLACGRNIMPRGLLAGRGKTMLACVRFGNPHVSHTDEVFRKTFKKSFQ